MTGPLPAGWLAPVYRLPPPRDDAQARHLAAHAYARGEDTLSALGHLALASRQARLAAESLPGGAAAHALAIADELHEMARLEGERSGGGPRGPRQHGGRRGGR